ncbi:MAG: TolC family protein [Candidatus Obscuribacterales bacterium]|nr:TolC family protein [Candidatus Obscuribacterales bacterium]
MNTLVSTLIASLPLLLAGEAALCLEPANNISLSKNSSQPHLLTSSPAHMKLERIAPQETQPADQNSAEPSTESVSDSLRPAIETDKQKKEEQEKQNPDAEPDGGSDGDSDSDSESKTEPDKKQPGPMGVIRFDASSRPRSLKGGLTIFDALDEALVKSPRAAAMRSLLPITRSLLARATEQPPPEYNMDVGVKAEQTRRMGVVFNWEPPWKVVFRLIVAKRMIDQKKLDLMSDLWKLRADVRHVYTETVVAQETLETLTSLYDLANRLRVVSEKRFQAGDVPELDLLKARLAESTYDVQRRVGLRRVIRAKQQLNIIMGRPPEKAISVPRLPPFLKTQGMISAATVKNPLLPNFSEAIPPLQYYIDRAVGNRYELKSVQQLISINEANLKKAYGNIVPNPQFWIGSSIAGNPPIGPKLSAYYFGVNVPTNMTSFQQGDIAEFKATATQLKYKVGAQKNVITAEVSSAYNNVLAARQWLKVYEEHILSDSYEVARLARRSYEVGQADITSTLQAQQNNVQIRSNYLDAIALYQKAFTELEMSCGEPLLEEE